MEIWKDIRGNEDIYQVSNYGRVKSLDRVIIRSNGRPITIKGKIIEPYEKDSGHLDIVLRKNGEREHKKVHQLVAEAFIPNPNGYTVVHHKNHNPNDNRVENLVWMSDETHRGMHTKERCSKRVDQIDKITGEVLHQWYSVHDVTKELGYAQGNISACARGEKQTAYDCVWKYVL